MEKRTITAQDREVVVLLSRVEEQHAARAACIGAFQQERPPGRSVTTSEVPSLASLPRAAAGSSLRPKLDIGNGDPTESVTEVRSGKKYTSERMFYPGYVLVEMDMDDHVWHVVKATPRVTGFVGTGQQPTPLSEEEVQHIVYRVGESKDKPKLKVKFEKNEQVRITEGPFATFTGIVDDVNEDRETLKVMVTIFGRSYSGGTGI